MRVLGVILVGMTVLAPMADAESGVIYCGPAFGQGASLKIEPARNRLCLSSGPIGEDYCARPGAQVLPLIRNVTGQFTSPDARNTFAYREYLAGNASRMQLVRVFDLAALPSADTVVVHWGEYVGDLMRQSLPASTMTIPTRGASSGEPVCSEGEF